MEKKVKIYSTPTCPYCMMAKQFLKNNNIEFEDIDVSSNQEKAEEMVDKLEQMSTSVLDIDGEIIISFDKDAIQKALNIYNSR